MTTNKRRKKKPSVLKLTPRSDRATLRMAMILAWESLEWSLQQKHWQAASSLIQRIVDVRP